MPDDSDPGPFDGMPDHDGATFDRGLDLTRLNAQTRAVYAAVRDGAWRTLREIADRTGAPEASVSARLRDLRKPKFGGFTVNRRRRGDPKAGLWEYQVLPPQAQEAA